MTDMITAPDRGPAANETMARIARIIDPAAFSPSDVIQINPSFSQLAALRKADEILTLLEDPKYGPGGLSIVFGSRVAEGQRA